MRTKPPPQTPVCGNKFAKWGVTPLVTSDHVPIRIKDDSLVTQKHGTGAFAVIHIVYLQGSL